MKTGKKGMLLLVLVLALSSVALFGCGTGEQPQEPQKPTVETVTDRVFDGFGTFTGTLTDGKPTEGKLTAGDYVYDGTFVDGFKVTGEGVMTYENGDVIDGSFVNGKLNGYGQAVYENGCIGIGYWKAGKLDGKAYFCWPQTVGMDVYYGDWVNGVRMGRGVYQFASGCYYDGEFNDWINGEGTFHWPGGNRFTGAFAGGAPVKGSTGFGVMDGTEGWIKVDEETGAWSWGTDPNQEA